MEEFLMNRLEKGTNRGIYPDRGTIPDRGIIR